MSYLVLARKYRPQSFDDLVGQEHVSQTLSNAIAQNRVAHAFLFTGARGVGKTTSARILAKCLNCLGKNGAAVGATARPCQTCASCTEIAAGVDMDVQEIDAASYNGVDEVRRLQEGLAFRPARDRFKIYIVDEVHMLSTAAWNAFLKTLEEPPPHVKFIFATTEVHKVPVTILSRCQRYDFKLVSAKRIGERLREVLDKESILAEDSAIRVLAREAAGSVRDAMSLLDQVIAYASQSITADDVARVLGVADREIMNKLSRAVIEGDAATALDVLNEVTCQGFDLVHLCRDLLGHVRNLVVAKVCHENQARELFDLTNEEAADVFALANMTDTDDLTRLFHGFSRAFDDIVRSGQVRAALEMTLVRLARRPPLLPLDELLSRLGELEKRLATGAPPPPRGGGGAGAVPSGLGGAGGAGLVGAQHAAPLPNPLRTAPELVGAQHAAPLPNSPEAASPIESDLVTWRAILAKVRDRDPAMASTLDLAAPLVVTREKIILGFEPESFENARVVDSDATMVLTQVAQDYFGVKTVVSINVAARGSRGSSIASIDATKRAQAIAQARAAVERHPMVQKAMAIFDAELQGIRLPAEEN